MSQVIQAIDEEDRIDANDWIAAAEAAAIAASAPNEPSVDDLALIEKTRRVSRNAILSSLPLIPLTRPVSKDYLDSPGTLRAVAAARSTPVVSARMPASLFELPQTTASNDQERLLSTAKGHLRGLSRKADELSTNDKLAAAELSPVEIAEDALYHAANKLQAGSSEGGSKNFPNLAREMMKLGTGLETFQTRHVLEKSKERCETHKNNIDALLKLNGLIPKTSPDKDQYEISPENKEKILAIAEELKGRGIDIFANTPLGEKLGKEHIVAANSQISHYIESSRLSIQEEFTTKISQAVTHLETINQIMRKVSEKDDQIKKTINSNMVRH